MFYFSWVFVGWKERVWGKLTASLQAPWRSWPIKWNPIFSLSWICEKYEKDACLLSRQNVPVFLFRIGFHVVKLNSLISSVLVTIDSLMQTNSSPGKTMLEKPQCNSDVPSDKQTCLKVAQLCPTLCEPMNYTVHGILQARMLEWVAVAFSRGSSQPRDWTQVPCIAGGFFTSEPPGKPKSLSMIVSRNQICNSAKRRGIGSRSYEFISCFLCSKYLCLEQVISPLCT